MSLSNKRSGRTRIDSVNESYLFRIDKIEPHYSFGTNHGHRNSQGYSEYHHTEIDAACLAPHKLDGRLTRFTLIADRKMAAAVGESGNEIVNPVAIGSLTIRGSRSEYLGSLPFDAALAMPNLVLAGGYRFIYLAGDPLTRGRALVRYMAFYREYDLSEL